MEKVLAALLFTSFLAPSAYARPLADQAGWEFTISLNAGYVSGQSNLAVSDENEVISDVYSEAESTNSFIGFPFARVQYTTEDLNTQFFLGNSRDQISISQFQIELGLVHQFQNASQLTVAYFPELPMFNETWQDPFLTNAKRIETDENAQGGRIELSRVAGSPFTLKYAFALTEVKDDKSGESWSNNSVGLTTQELNDLQRSSQYHRLAVETMFPVYSKLFLKPTLQYTTRLADGDAVSYDEFDFQLGFLIFSGRHTSITTLSIANTAYKENNPIFDSQQDSFNLGIFSVYSYSQAFNVKPLTFTLIGGYNQKDSDITFYDESGFIVSTGLAYTF